MRTEKRILIVDDDEAIRTLITRVLHRRSLIVDTARNGKDALLRIAERRYKVIILDLMMPHMNGFEFLEHLARLPISTRPTVLVLTAGMEPKPFDTTLVVGTIHKPFDLDILVSAVHACLGNTAEQPRPDVAAPLEIDRSARREEAN